MDPNATLRQCRQAVEDYNRCNANQDPDGCHEAMAELWCAFQDLDEWIMKGGFLPDDWINASKGIISERRSA